MIKYRIVSNGINYRIQWQGKTLFLRRPKWYWLRQNNYADSWIAEFSSTEEARGAIAQQKCYNTAKKQGYKPI